MKNLTTLLLIFFLSFGIIGGCETEDRSWVGPISFSNWPKKTKCAKDERRCHGICYPKSLDCPDEDTTDTEIFIKSHSCNKISSSQLELIVRGVASGPIGTEITFEFDNPVRRSYEIINCIPGWDIDQDQGFNEDYCKRTELSENPVTSWIARTIGNTDTFSQFEDLTVRIDGKSVSTTINCPDATGDIPREDCFTFYEIAGSECPAEKVLDVCERYECFGQCGGYIECSDYGDYIFYSLPYFPDDFTGCRIKDCNTIDCEQAKNIYVEDMLRWVEYIDGQESEAGCF